MTAWWKRDEVLAIGAGALALLGITQGPKAAAAVSDVVGRGRLVTSSIYNERLGIVLTAPDILAKAASSKLGRVISNDVYAAARMARSEGANTGGIRIHVALNDLASFPYADSLFGLLTYSTDKSRRGIYGAQYSPAVPPQYPKANKRRYATIRDPYEKDILTAEMALAERAEGIDRALGATRFIDKSAMGVQPGTVPFEVKNAEWVKAGYEPFTVAQGGSDFVLYRKVT